MKINDYVSPSPQGVGSGTHFGVSRSASYEDSCGDLVFLWKHCFNVLIRFYQVYFCWYSLNHNAMAIIRKYLGQKYVVNASNETQPRLSGFQMIKESVNPYVTIGLSHPYLLDESTLLFCRGIRSNYSFLFHFWMKFL